MWTRVRTYRETDREKETKKENLDQFVIDFLCQQEQTDIQTSSLGYEVPYHNNKKRLMFD